MDMLCSQFGVNVSESLERLIKCGAKLHALPKNQAFLKYLHNRRRTARRVPRSPVTPAKTSNREPQPVPPVSRRPVLNRQLIGLWIIIYQFLKQKAFLSSLFRENRQLGHAHCRDPHIQILKNQQVLPHRLDTAVTRTFCKSLLKNSQQLFHRVSRLLPYMES